ncbi:MAG: hypothetical protein ABID38_01920 [Candidatus Diapherotrites archaeon]
MKELLKTVDDLKFVSFRDLKDNQLEQIRDLIYNAYHKHINDETFNKKNVELFIEYHLKDNKTDMVCGVRKGKVISAITIVYDDASARRELNLKKAAVLTWWASDKSFENVGLRTLVAGEKLAHSKGYLTWGERLFEGKEKTEHHQKVLGAHESAAKFLKDYWKKTGFRRRR